MTTPQDELDKKLMDSNPKFLNKKNIIIIVIVVLVIIGIIIFYKYNYKDTFISKTVLTTTNHDDSFDMNDEICNLNKKQEEYLIKIKNVSN